jgi:hypothetical protein
MGAFVFDEDLCVFTPLMDKRLSPGPFYTAPIVQGHWDGTGTPDVVTFPRGALTGNQAQIQYANLDPYQGSAVKWWTAETASAARASGYSYVWYASGNFWARYDYANNRFEFRAGGVTHTDAQAIVAGTTYCIIFSWDCQNAIDGTNGCRSTITNTHTYGGTLLTASAPDATIVLGSDGTKHPAQAIIEGLTLYRRVLLDSNGYGVKDMNGNPLAAASDELTAIYAAGAGVDPTLVTGSEDVCTCVPTNSTVEALVSGDGEAWSWPWDQNLLDVWGMWDGGLPGTDYAIELGGGSSPHISCGSGVMLDDIPSGGQITINIWVRHDISGSNEGIIEKCLGNTNGWRLYKNTADQIRFQVNLATADADRIEDWNIVDGKEHLITAYYNDGTKTCRLALDGRWGTSHTGVGAYQSDAAYALEVGRMAGTFSLHGAVAWWELWDNDHHGGAAGTDFIPPRIPQTPPIANLVETWWADEGTGVTVAARVNPGAPPAGCDGTITNGAWSSIWEQDGTPVIPYSLEFFQQNDGINFGSGANIDNLFAGDCTIEFYARLPVDTGDAFLRVIAKTNADASEGWEVWGNDAGALIFRVHHATDDCSISVAGAKDDLEHYWALDWDVGTLTGRVFMDGILQGTDTAVGAYIGDAALDCLVNARSPIGLNDGKFAIGPIRLSNNRRYTTNNFVPPDRVNWVANDANAHLLCTMRDGAGATVTDTSGNGYNGTITFGADTKWHTTPDMAVDEPGAVVYGPKGYNLGVDTAGEGMYIEQVVVAETDYVVFPVLSIGESGRARPQIRIYDVSNAANVVTFIGPMLYGTHAVGADSATLVPTTPRWIADALIGATVYNITDGSSATITDNTEGVVTGALAGGTENDWDVGDVFVIRFPHGYARWVWAENFCFQTPTGCTLLRVFIENANAEGVMAIHQVQVVPNLLANGDHESLTGGNPDLITLWTNDGLDAGDTQASSGGGAIIHSGAEALQWNVGAVANELMYYTMTVTANRYHAMGGWLYGNAAGGIRLQMGATGQGVLQYDPTVYQLPFAIRAQWELSTGVIRAVQVAPRYVIHPNAGADGARYSDDVWFVALNNITLTVAPASFVNSQEAGGLRIDGLDDYQQPTTLLFPTFGMMMWETIPRHDDSDVVAFGNNNPHIFWASAPVANYFRLFWTAANNLRLETNDGAATTTDWATGGGVVLAGVRHRWLLLYTATWMRVWMDGVLRINHAPGGGLNFGANVPTTIFWGEAAPSAQQWDAVFA